jgi:hypothetical protein
MSSSSDSLVRFIVTSLYVTAHVCVMMKIIDILDRSRIINAHLGDNKEVARRRKNPYAVALGRKGGLKGGPARAANMTPEQRSESARNAVLARWAKERASEDAGNKENNKAS